MAPYPASSASTDSSLTSAAAFLVPCPVAFYSCSRCSFLLLLLSLPSSTASPTFYSLFSSSSLFYTFFLSSLCSFSSPSSCPLCLCNEMFCKAALNAHFLPHSKYVAFPPPQHTLPAPFSNSLPIFPALPAFPYSPFSLPLPIHTVCPCSARGNFIWPSSRCFMACTLPCGRQQWQGGRQAVGVRYCSGRGISVIALISPVENKTKCIGARKTSLQFVVVANSSISVQLSLSLPH